MPEKFAVIFLAWGDRFIQEVRHCIEASGDYLSGYDRYLITDQDSVVETAEPWLTGVIRADFQLPWHLRKAELHHYLPVGYEAYLFLDSDTIVIGDLSLGFQQAKRHGLAISPATSCSFEMFPEFKSVMEGEHHVLNSEVMYNSGVFFFYPTPAVQALLEKWEALAARYADQFQMDQPYLTYAMELLAFCPYVLSPSYNCRGFGEIINDRVRVWHSHEPMPTNINLPATPRRIWPEWVETGVTLQHFSKGFIQYLVQARIERQINHVRRKLGHAGILNQKDKPARKSK